MKVAVSTVGETFYCVAVNLVGSDNQKYTIRKRGKCNDPDQFISSFNNSYFVAYTFYYL